MREEKEEADKRGENIQLVQRLEVEARSTSSRNIRETKVAGVEMSVRERNTRRDERSYWKPGPWKESGFYAE